MPAESLNSDGHCGICDLDTSRYEIARSQLWRLRHHPDPAPMLGWLFLDAQRHVGGPVDFTPAEAAAWGPAVQAASGLVRELTGCDRVYAIAFGEGARHLHLHLIPRFGQDRASAAWAVADVYRAVEQGSQPAADPGAVAAWVARARNLDLQLDGSSRLAQPASGLQIEQQAAQRLEPEEITDLAHTLPQWQMAAGKLHRELRFSDFEEAFDFMNQLAPIAEAMGHHPEWSNVWNRVTIDLITHDIGGLSSLDVELARQIDRIAAQIQTNSVNSQAGC